MRKALLTFVSVVLLSTAFASSGTSYYRIDEASVDQAFAQAKEVSLQDLVQYQMINLGDVIPMQQTGEVDATTAWLLAFFLGYLGVHRLYLGTSTGTFIGYLLTGGGCGVLATVDWLLLMINGMINDVGIDSYINNPKFFMWTN